jgi:hypothetical protein
MWEGS